MAPSASLGFRGAFIAAPSDIARRIAAYQPQPAHPRAGADTNPESSTALHKGDARGGGGGGEARPASLSALFAIAQDVPADGPVDAAATDRQAREGRIATPLSLDPADSDPADESARSPRFQPAVALSDARSADGTTAISGRKRRRLRRRARAVATGLAVMHVQRAALVAGLRAARARLVDVRVHIAQVMHAKNESELEVEG